MSKIKIIGPNDRTPRPDRGIDYMDYRGIAQEQECRRLQKGVSLGRYLHPKSHRLGRELFLSEELLKRHCAVIGRTGAGKTAGIIEPWTISLLKAGSSVVVVDVVGNLYSSLKQAAQTLGCRFWHWDSNTPARSQSWNWLDEIQLDDADRLEGAIISILGKRPSDERLNWHYDLDCNWLRTAIGIVKEIFGASATPQFLYKLIAEPNQLTKVFERYPNIKAKYFDEMGILLSAPPLEYLKMIAGLSKELSLFKQDDVIKVSQKSDFCLNDIDSQPTLLVIGDRLQNQRSAKLTSLMLGLLFHHVNRRSLRQGNWQQPLYFIIDEAPRHQRKIDFGSILATARNANVGICLAAQDVTQFGSEREAAQILNNCNTIITTKGVPPESAAYLSRLLGKRKVSEHTVSKQPLFKDLDRPLWAELLGIGTQSTSVRQLEVPALGERELMYLPSGNYPAIVLVSPVSSKPILVDLDLAFRTV